MQLDYLNTQGQPKLVWPPSFALARAYLDQLERSNGLAGEEISAAREALASAEKGSDTERRDELNKLASRLETASGSASDAAKVRTLTETVQRLAAVPAVAHAGGTE